MASAAATFSVEPASAGEVGAKINAAVTQSDLGVSVRRSVVRGAQLIDKLDGRWEKFSDDFGLGAERSKREARPVEREIPPLKPLDQELAVSVLQAADKAFLAIVPVGEETLKRRIEKVDALVRKSFERAGLKLDQKEMDGEVFNYLSYVHFKAFNEILVQEATNFKQFRLSFEDLFGSKLCQLLLQNNNATTSTSAAEIGPDMLKDKLKSALADIDIITDMLQAKGFVALVERAEIDPERLADWAEDLSDLQFSVAVNKDVTQDTQILLAEQGFRLVPDIPRYAVTSSLRKYLTPVKEDVATEEYYMDTSYSSDPDLFEVKQVLINIVIESV